MQRTVHPEETAVAREPIHLEELPSTGEPAQVLAQFEPDPDGAGGSEAPDAAPAGNADDPQWVVWSDPLGESAWAASELSQMGTGWRV